MKKVSIWTAIVLVIIALAGFAAYHSFQTSASEYDVVVIGDEPEGVAAAVSAARNGAKTLLVGQREELGGLFTYGMLNFLDIPQGETGESVSKGIFAEWHQLVGGQSAFGIEEAKVAFRTMVENEPNITLLTATEIEQAILEENQLTGVVLTKSGEKMTVKGKTFIDATQDADLAVMAGAPYFTGGEDIGLEDKKMSVTLMIHLKNVDWEGIKQTANSEKFGPAGYNETAAWGFGALHHVYPPVEENLRLRGLNLAKVGDEYYINALQIFGVDGLDEESIQDGIERGKRETQHILSYLQEEFPGFENAEIASYPSELYIRETRHVIAEYQLPMSDVWTNRDHWDNIGYGAYPVDIQAQTPQDYGAVVAEPKQYAIPFRSLVPKKVDGLLVVGRSSGYSSIAAGSARIVPTGMTTAEAAGAAAALAVEEKTSFRSMSKDKQLIETLRTRLAGQGSYVEHLTTDYPYQNEWFDPAIQTLMDFGLLKGGYDNDLKVDEPATTEPFLSIVKEISHRVPNAVLGVANQQAGEDEKSPDSDQTKGEHASQALVERANQALTKRINQVERVLTRDEAAAILAEIFFDDSAETDHWQLLVENKLINEELANRLATNSELTNKEMYAIQAAVIDYLR